MHAPSIQALTVVSRPHWIVPVSREETWVIREKFRKVGWRPPNHKPNTIKVVASAKSLWDRHCEHIDVDPDDHLLNSGPADFETWIDWINRMAKKQHESISQLRKWLYQACSIQAQKPMDCYMANASSTATPTITSTTTLTRTTTSEPTTTSTFTSTGTANPVVPCPLTQTPSATRTTPFAVLQTTVTTSRFPHAFENEVTMSVGILDAPSGTSHSSSQSDVAPLTDIFVLSTCYCSLNTEGGASCVDVSSEDCGVDSNSSADYGPGGAYVTGPYYGATCGDANACPKTSSPQRILLRRGRSRVRNRLVGGRR